MTKVASKLDKLLNPDTVFTFTELKSLMNSLGYTQNDMGKTSGSRVRFFRSSDERVLILHKPHPGDDLKSYQKKQIIQF